MRQKKNQESKNPVKPEENKSKKQKKERSSAAPVSVTIVFLTVLTVGLFSFLRGMSTVDLIRNLVIGCMGSLLVIFLMAQARLYKEYDYDNDEMEVRFLVIYLLGLIMAVACAYLPSAGWPFLVVFVSLALFSNTLIGLATGTLLLTVTMMLSAAPMATFVMYFICGLVGVCLFRKLDDSYKIGIPLLISIMLLTVAETASVVIYANETLKPELFMIPMMNVAISLVLLLIILKLFSAVVIYRYRDKYMEINDPEFELLVEMKNKSKESYYQAVHTAYFCDRIARRLNLDADATKACGYYHKIGMIKDDNSFEQVAQLAVQYVFPPITGRILQEFLDKNVPVTRKETAVLLMSDAVISSILFLMSKEKGAIDYDQVIETVFKKKLESDVLKDCEITMAEISLMKKIFKEEKLYYDFLH